MVLYFLTLKKSNGKYLQISYKTRDIHYCHEAYEFLISSYKNAQEWCLFTSHILHSVYGLSR